MDCIWSVIEKIRVCIYLPCMIMTAEGDGGFHNRVRRWGSGEQHLLVWSYNAL